MFGVEPADPCPEGDPAQIAELAATLRRIAGAAASVRPPSLGRWESGAAQAARGQLRGVGAATGRAADSLRSCAAALDHAAHDLESRRQAWRRRQEETR
ncbi:hypothetical protein ABZ816_37055 [Actinosynnema sp. NPDC047251]|uniref:hypothetical protein n=1 Tax=Saccharothrix espanaensis TaxID=103731 RepID=UPI00031580B4|nr:hypothetical protein [Saccharothrix espanaensis]